MGIGRSVDCKIMLCSCIWLTTRKAVFRAQDKARVSRVYGEAKSGLGARMTLEWADMDMSERLMSASIPISMCSVVMLARGTLVDCTITCSSVETRY